MPTLEYFYRMECGSEDRFSEIRGPFKEFLQLTYTELRTGPDGDFVAQYGEDGWWYERGSENYWSDIVIWADIKPE